MIDPIIQRVTAGEDLSMQETADAMDHVMSGSCSEVEIAQLLTALHEKGETTDEVAGAAEALRRHMTPIKSSRKILLDTCGTGGDGSGTFNISTAAALVTAAAGVAVAKHGNRGITSKSGSADVLTALGVNINADVSTVQRCLDELGICFCFAPLMHPSMKNVAVVRRELGFPTIFNLLGPLCNPARAPFQLLGVGRPALRPLLSHALQRLGIERAAVVCGQDGLDEVTLSGKTDVSLVSGDSSEEFVWSPSDFGLAESPPTTLQADGPATSATMIQKVLDGELGAPRDIVVLNAAAAIWTVRQSAELPEAAGRASEAIDTGAARLLLRKLVEMSYSS